MRCSLTCIGQGSGPLPALVEGPAKSISHNVTKHENSQKKFPNSDTGKQNN
jgi:hypothetical protein